MPTKRKSNRRLDGAPEDGGRSRNRELELETQVEALKKELDKKDGIHRDELRAASNTLDAPSQKHYIEVLDERDELLEQLKQLQTRLDEAEESAAAAEIEKASKAQPLSDPVVVQPQGLSHKYHLLQLIDQHTRRKEHLQDDLETIQRKRAKIHTENEIKKQEIREIKARRRPAHNRAGKVSRAQGSSSRYALGNKFTARQSSDDLQPPELTSASAYPSLLHEQGASRQEQTPPVPQRAYSKAGKSSSQTLKFVNTHLGKSESNRVDRELAFQKDQEDKDDTAE